MGGIKQKKRKNNRNNKKNRHKSEKIPSETDLAKETDEAGDEDEVESSNEDPAPKTVSRKRELNDDDSDAEDIPKRKKKKKPVVTESTDKKGKKSIRQMKREKFAERQAEAEASAKNELKSQCLSYISQWKHNKQNWKFMKAKQVWLYKNKFSASLVPSETWPLLLEYFESTQGNIRNMLLEDANKIIKQMDEWTEKHGKSEEKEDEIDDEESDKPDSTSYKRARDLIQSLQE